MLTHTTNIWEIGDQFRKYYELRMKSRKVYKYIFWFLVELCMLNTYILHQYSPTTGKSFHTFKDFRVELAKLLIGDYTGRKRRGRPVHLLPAPSPQRPNLAHFPRKTTKGCAVHTAARLASEKRHRGTVLVAMSDYATQA